MAKITLDKIAYEPHPVSMERKRELNSQGFKIIDAVFRDPLDHDGDGEKGGAKKPVTPPPAKTDTAIPPGAADALALADGNFMAFKSAAKKVLGDALPAKKPEIVAALEALAADGQPVSETPDGVPTAIPEEWEAMTDDEMLALAADLSGGPVVETENGTPVERAKAIIQAAVDDRASRNG
jgi:hypothetical protein